MAQAMLARSPGGVKWLLRAVGLILSLSTVVGLMNLAAHHGIHWRAYLGTLVATYRAVMAPFYHYFVTPVFGWLFALIHIRLTEPMKDVITVLILLLAAANAESFIRENRSIVFSMFNRNSQFSVFSDKEPALLMDRVMKIVAIMALAIAMLGTIGLMIVYPNRLGLPNFLIPAYLIFFVGLLAFLVTRDDEPEWAAMLFFAMLIPFVPLFLLLDLVLTPLLAWRMSSSVLGLFGALYILNVNFEKWGLGPLPALARRALIDLWMRLGS